MKQDAYRIFTSALEAAHAGNAVRRHFRMPAGHFGRVVVIAVGKAAYQMAAAVVQQSERPVDQVIVVTKYGHAGPPVSGWEIIEAGHPIPDENGLRAACLVRDVAASLAAHDLLIVAVSGGASALLPAPRGPITLATKQEITAELLRRGATIREINAVRKQLSFLKGGKLAALAAPARVLGLLLSDVIGDPLDVIGSGLTVPDSSIVDPAAVLRNYGLPVELEFCQPVAHLHNVENVLVGSNKLALEAAAEKARELGYQPVILGDQVQGEAREVARAHAALLLAARPGACLLSGGETTVTVKGGGKGGRNQEFALALAIEIAGREDLCALCAGTDGTDGPTDAAGAYVDGATLRRAPNARDFLDNNDSYTYFEALGDLVKIGPTGTNVMDINIMLARKS